MTVSRRAWYKLALSWGVTPVMSEKFDSADVLFYHAALAAKRILSLKKGDCVVMSGGVPNGVPGTTNMIKIETI